MSAETFASGRYRVERMLGHGGMALVHLARDRELSRPVALKVLAENLAGDETFRSRFLREARLAARLSHPNVVHVYDAGEEDGRPYIVMEYVESETLAQILRRRGRLPAEEAVALAIQACAGLAHAHEAGLVHRDVKPHNLLVRPDGALKIADFGIARAAETTHITQAGTVLGTGAYLAPEQAAGEEVTGAADVYSLGVVVYEALTGRTPYRYETLAELLRKQSAEPIEPIRELVRDVPEELEDAVMRCLARNPAYRPSARELARELAAAVPEATTEPLPEAEAATAPLPLPPASGRRSADRSRAWAGAAGLFVVGLAVAAGALALRDDGSAPPPSTTPAVAPVARGATAERQWRNLAEWLRTNSG